jgi:hypothetical protein
VNDSSLTPNSPANEDVGVPGIPNANKDESKLPQPMKNLKLATAPSPAGPFKPLPAPINPPGSWVEGPTALQVGAKTILYFDA